MQIRTPPAEAFPIDLLKNLTLRELRGKFKRSTLGWTWSIVNPVVTIAVYSFVFGVFLEQKPPESPGKDIFAFYLMVALLPWTFLSNGLTGSIQTVVANAGLIKKVWFPRWVLPASTVLNWLVTFAIEMSVAAVLLQFVGGHNVWPYVPVVVVLMAIQFFFVLGLGLVLAPLNVYFRDVEHFTNIFLNIWFWTTPIIYLATNYEDRYVFGIEVATLAKLNPMYHFIALYRDLMYFNRMPSLLGWFAVFVSALATMALGSYVFRRLEPRFADEL